MDNLKQILESALRGYAGKGLNGQSYFTKDERENVMTVTAVFDVRGKHFVDTSILARIVGNQIVIEDDKTNKPLVEALVSAGIPREQIVLAYAGETLATA